MNSDNFYEFSDSLRTMTFSHNSNNIFSANGWPEKKVNSRGVIRKNWPSEFLIKVMGDGAVRLKSCMRLDDSLECQRWTNPVFHVYQLHPHKTSKTTRFSMNVGVEMSPFMCVDIHIWKMMTCDDVVKETWTRGEFSELETFFAVFSTSSSDREKYRVAYSHGMTEKKVEKK